MRGLSAIGYLIACNVYYVKYRIIQWRECGHHARPVIPGHSLKSFKHPAATGKDLPEFP